ncbi:hypothetical protein ACUHMQ_09085 [Chitinimonas sp. PSY-7]|uniref:hypothetical protein n=1 Tax=Chitinimonas sp. PSY-7 TaxID=3459088 RepID=UPI00404035E3
MKSIYKAVFVAGVLSTMSATANASSSDGWAEFRQDVTKACIAATKDQIKKPKVTVDPFGSESYGLALVQGQSAHSKDVLSIICVYDKKTKKTEIGGELKLR